MLSVSIATPTFGTAPFLESCCRSVQEQTVPARHIVCRGGPAIRSGFKLPLSASLIERDPDPGMVACWNEAALSTDSDVIGFLSDDNAVEPGFVEKLTRYLEDHPSCEVVFCNQSCMGVDGNINLERTDRHTVQFGRDRLREGMLSPADVDEVILRNSIPLEACLVRRHVWHRFGPFRMEAKGAFDLEFLCRLLSGGVQFGFLPEYLVKFRWHDGAYCVTSGTEHLRGHIWTMEQLMDLDKTRHDYYRRTSVALKGRLLRHRLQKGERLALIRELLGKRGGGISVLKNTVAGWIGRR